MSKYKLVIFDLDGTIADTSPGILNCIRYTQKMMNLPQISYEAMLSHVGPPMEESYNRNFGLTGSELKKAVSYHKEYAMENGYKELTIYPGIIELCDLLRKSNIYIAIATLKAQSTAIKIFENLGLEDKFDIIAGNDINTPKTKSQLLDYCIEKFNVSREEALLIGDSEYDAIGAYESGIDFIAVTYGFGFKNHEQASSYKNIAVCDDAESIKKIIF
ncbi:MAG: HAD hydrolase-like protein [Oscillospiraceae bacterium]|nr:HAD hydrolase-like protein [Oscillospiraceae bacterium]